MRIDWRRPVVFVHRWLGIFGGVFFAAWFASGIVMMYARMPRLSPAERLARLEPLDLSSARVSLRDVLPAQQLTGLQQIRVLMLRGRPAYRTLAAGSWSTTFADTGERVARVTAEEAGDQVRRFAPESAARVRFAGRIEEPDQWTFEIRRRLPLYRFALGDAGDSYVYVSERSGEVVLRTTARERRIAYAGAVLHWLYFAPFRRHGTAWSQTIIALSLAGSVMCLLGLVWGVYSGLPSGYRGWMRWHHYAGLVFGVFTLGWIFSGLLSMDPWDWHPSTSPTRAQREAFTGARFDAAKVTIDQLRSAALEPEAPAKEIEIVPFHGEPRLIVNGRSRAVIDRGALLAAARAAMPDARVIDAAWLTDYDAYYYDRQREAPLPVLRVRYGDARATWLYVDAMRGTILRKEERLTRVNRWLYHGLHSLDFPLLYTRRPLWDVVVIALSLGGFASVVTAAVPAWRRVRRRRTRQSGARRTLV